MYYSMELYYTRLLESTIEEQFEVERYVHECLLFSEGVDIYAGLAALNEGVGEKIKTGWQKFIDWIKKVWAKFTEAMTKVFNTDKGWLEQYKDIILKKRPVDYNVTMPDYDKGIKTIFATSIKEVTAGDLAFISQYTKNPDMFKNPTEGAEALVSKAASINNATDIMTKAGIAQDDSTDTISAKLHQYFVGGSERVVSTTSLNMTDLYNYCHEYDKISSNIKADHDNFIKSCENISKAFEDAYNKAAVQAKAATQDNSTQQQNVNASYSIMHNGMISINEDIKREENNNTAQDKTDAANIRDASAKGYTKAADDNEDKTKQIGDAVGKTVVGANKDVDEFLKAVKDYFNSYRTRTGYIFSQKSTAAKQIYTDYMSLLRAHVRDYVGDTKSNDSPQQTGTNYNTNQGGGQQQQTPQQQPAT